MVTTRPTAPSYIIKRPRLTKLLDESEARIILLCAPAGYGKTTLAREWVETQSELALWYAAGPSSSDIAALCLEIAEKLRTRRGDSPESLERLRMLAAHGATPHALAQGLAGVMPDADTILAIDDYQHVCMSAEADAFVRELITNAQARALIASRVRPSWITPRMLLYGEAIVLGKEDLALTDDEAREVLVTNSKTGQARILAQAQGWPAVIGLAARGGSSGETDGHLSPAGLYGFFADDLFRTAPGAIQRALLVLAAGGDADPATARELLGDDYEALLSEAADRGFVNHGPNDSLVIHPLLRGFLHKRLHDSGKAQVNEIVSRVVHCLSNARRWDDCLATLAVFPSAGLLSQTMRSALSELLASGRTETVKRWLAVANAQQHDDPIFILAAAEVAQRGGSDAQAQALAEHAAARLNDPHLAARAHLVAARAAHMRDDSAAIAKHASHAHGLAPDRETRLEALWLAWLDSFERQLPEETAKAFDRLCAAGAGNPDAALRLECARGMTMFESGQIFEQIALCERAASLLPHVGDPLLRTNFLNQYAHATISNAQYERTLALAELQIEEAEASGLEFVIDHALLSRTGAFTGLRRLQLARRTLEELQRREDSLTLHVSANATLLGARLRIAAGDLERASILLTRDPPSSTPRALQGEILAHRGLVLAARGELEQASRTLDMAQRRSEFLETVTVARLAAAIVGIVAKRPSATAQAISVVEEVIATGLGDAVITAARSFPTLAQACAQDELLAPKLVELFSASRDIDLGRKAGLAMPRELRRCEGLTPREQGVYELMIQGRTNREIAGTLFISESTAKVHVRHIFEKLGVHSRAEAAAAYSDDAR